MDDPFLIQQVLAGNKNAFRFLVLRYQRPVFKFLGSFQTNAALTEELAQEVFLRVYKNLHTYDPQRGASFSSWIFTIAKHLVLNENSKARHRSELLRQDNDWTELNEIEDLQSDLQQDLEKKESKKALQLAIEELPPEFKGTLVLSCLNELSLEEIAKLEKCSLGTVKSRIFRGKQLLRKLLTQKGVFQNG